MSGARTSFRALPLALTRRRALFLAPLGVAAAAGGGFYAMLAGMGQGRFDPHDVGAPVLNRPVPDFSLPDQAPGRGFSSRDLRTSGHFVLVNFFASWCIPCVEEADLLASVAGSVPVWGVAYEDKEANAAGFVARTGNAYARLGRDPAGTVAIDWGVTGVPESFLVDGAGIIRWHVAGPLTGDNVTRELLPRLS